MEQFYVKALMHRISIPQLYTGDLNILQVLNVEGMIGEQILNLAEVFWPKIFL